MRWHQFRCAACQTHNEIITAAVLQLIEQGNGTQSHFFNGRFENIYLSRERLPSLEIILQTAVTKAAEILNSASDELKIGFWFNLMKQGDVTTLHTHDDNDELLSGTYYLQTPPQSGELVLLDGAMKHVIKPQEGMFVFFPPEMPHEVTLHQNSMLRLSVGFNIGAGITQI